MTLLEVTALVADNVEQVLTAVAERMGTELVTFFPALSLAIGYSEDKQRYYCIAQRGAKYISVKSYDRDSDIICLIIRSLLEEQQ